MTFAVRINLASAVFGGQVLLLYMEPPALPHANRPARLAKTTQASASNNSKTFREVKHFPETAKFLGLPTSYTTMVFKTVIASSSDLRRRAVIQGGLEQTKPSHRRYSFDDQFMAFFGALFWGKLAGWIGAKQSVLVVPSFWAVVLRRRTV